MIGYGAAFNGCLFEVVHYLKFEPAELEVCSLLAVIVEAELPDSAWFCTDMKEVQYVTVAMYQRRNDVYRSNGSLEAMKSYYENRYYYQGDRFGNIRHVLAMRKLL